MTDVPASELVVIGGSAGAIDALNVILPALPQNYPVPVALLLHVPPDKPSYLSEVFQRQCRLSVKEAEDKEPVLPGYVYIAPPNYHLLLERDGHFALSVDEPVLFSRPSIDVLFESAADSYGARLTAVLLSGASEDGARGLARVLATGGSALVQAPETASARLMPEAAIRHASAAQLLPPAQIAAFVTDIAGRRPAAVESP